MDRPEESKNVRGGCLCGAVRYVVHGPLRPVIACHCRQCRRSSGHFAAATAARPEQLRLEGEDAIRWYRSSELASRGFCATCGSNLFWRPSAGDRIGIWAGTLDEPTGLTTIMHICVDDAGDYYRVPEDISHHRGSEHGVAMPTSRG